MTGSNSGVCGKYNGTEKRIAALCGGDVVDQGNSGLLNRLVEENLSFIELHCDACLGTLTSFQNIIGKPLSKVLSL